MENHFFMLFINSRTTRDYYENCAKRTTNLASINKTQMRSTPIAFPPLEEQNAIVEKVNGLMSLCDQLEKEIENKETTQMQWMQSCLREVFQVESTEEPFLPIAAEPRERYGKE
jgi:type I restriction enzyme S subunit